MTVDPTRLKALKNLTETRLTAVQAEFLACCRREDALRENLRQLVDDRGRSVRREATKDSARNAGADIRWLAWIEDRRSTINTELALALSRKAEVRKKLRKAFGKDRVLEVLIQKAKH